MYVLLRSTVLFVLFLTNKVKYYFLLNNCLYPTYVRKWLDRKLISVDALEGRNLTEISSVFPRRNPRRESHTDGPELRVIHCTKQGVIYISDVYNHQKSDRIIKLVYTLKILKPIGGFTYQQVKLPKFVCSALHGSQKKQWLSPYRALTDKFL